MIQHVIDFAIVLATTVGVAAAIGCLYSLGIRQLAKAGASAESCSADNASAAGAPDINNVASTSNAAGINTASTSCAKVLAYVCFGLCIAIVAVSIWLMVPVFPKPF